MFAARRNVFMERMGGGVAIFHSCPEFARSGDSLEFSYRQDSRFYYPYPHSGGADCRDA